MNFIIASALAAAVPISLYLIYIYKHDRFDPEPIGLYLKNFLWGAIGAITLSAIGSILLGELVVSFLSNPLLRKNSDALVVAPLVEECMKGIFLFRTVASRKFDNMTDGLVYGGAIGLGFGMTENFLYFITYQQPLGNWIALVLIRTLFTAVMHGVSTGTFGAFMGYAKFRPVWYKILMPPLGITVAVFIHFAWNLGVSMESGSLTGFAFLAGSILLFMGVFNASLANERKMLITELSEEEESGLLPRGHAAILASEARDKQGWIDERIRKPYVTAATTLAFRKMQQKHSSGFNRDFYVTEAESARRAILTLLHPTAEAEGTHLG